jgi:tRNA modification GTPase
VWNKCDLAPLSETVESLLRDTAIPEGAAASLPQRAASLLRLIPFSAKTGEGLSALTDAAVRALEAAFGGSVSAGSGSAIRGPAAGTERQKELIDRAVDAVTESLSLAKAGAPLDIIAPTLREGVNCLGEITGEVSTADILETMFKNFCIGK